MSVLVKGQFTWKEERSRAERTPVSLVPGMAAPVHVQVARLGERAGTEGTGEGPLSRMLALMHGEVTGSDGFATYWTGQPIRRARF